MTENESQSVLDTNCSIQRADDALFKPSSKTSRNRPKIQHKTREGGNYSDIMRLKAARRDSISNITSFGASSLNCRWTQCRFI